ncbi:MAG: adenine nucleotide alpha hydrolase [Rhizobiales bacterium NRL2]|jgi:uncharacterized protein|nr:MAG: adenine nucleotide alpha hydrolase [Rhizobiales bacterium NRL2]
MPDGSGAPSWGEEAAAAEGRLLAVLRAHEGLTVAVSGGIDSMTLAHVAHRLGERPVRMAHAVSPAVPPAATARVRAYAAREGWDLHVVEAGEFADPDYLKNPVNRCYFCKTNLYDRLAGLAAGAIASGANVDDLGDYRPGLTAAAERDVVHPYVEAGIGKADIRALARRYGLDDIAELPAQPCLASRVETGIAIESADLAFIDRVETLLRRRFGENRTIRCRITAAGVAVEADEALAGRFAEMRAMAAADCAAEARRFLGVRPYRRGSAFLHGEGAAPRDASGGA